MKIKTTNAHNGFEHLPKRKLKLSDNGDIESIWIAVDEPNKKMYLLNHALAFYPFPSWGAEFDLADKLEVKEIKGDSPDKLELTFPEFVLNHIPTLKDDDGNITLDMDTFFNAQSNTEEE